MFGGVNPAAGATRMGQWNDDRPASLVFDIMFEPYDFIQWERAEKPVDRQATMARREA